VAKRKEGGGLTPLSGQIHRGGLAVPPSELCAHCTMGHRPAEGLDHPTTINRLTRKEIQGGGDSFSYLSERHANCLGNLSLCDNISAFYGKEALAGERYKELCNILSFVDSGKAVFFLSGGERKKAELIFTFLKDSSYYVLDEPFKSLDKTTCSALLSFLRREGASKGVIITNNQSGFEPEDGEGIINLNDLCKNRQPKSEPTPEKLIRLQGPRRSLLLKSAFLSHPTFFILRSLFVLLASVSFSASLAFLPKSDSEARKSGIVGSEPYSNVVNDPAFFPFSDDPLLKRSLSNESDRISLSSWDEKTVFVTSSTLNGSLWGKESFDDVPFINDGVDISLFDSSGAASSLHYETMSTNDYEKEINSLPPLLIDASKNGKSIYFLSPQSLKKLLSLGGLGSIKRLDGTPLRGRYGYAAIETYTSLGDYHLELSSSSSKDAAPLVVDDDAEPYLTYPGAEDVSINYTLHFGMTTSSHFKCAVSQDGAAHISSGLLLNYLIFDSYSPMALSYQFAIFPTNEIQNSFLKAYTPVPTGQQQRREVIFSFAIASFAFTGILAVIFCVFQTDKEKKNRQERHDLLKKFSMKDGEMVWNGSAFALSSIMCLALYFPFRSLANNVYRAESLSEGGLEETSVFTPSFISSYYSGWNQSFYRLETPSFYCFLLLALGTVFFMASIVRLKRKRK
jgi:hypothetical protein